MGKKWIFVVVLALSGLAFGACSGPTTPQFIPVVITVQVPPAAATPVFIPVLVTVEVPITITQPVSNVTFAETQAAPVETKESPNIEEEVDLWGVYPEGMPTPDIGNADTPALAGKSLRCSLRGGSPYSNVHCYRNLPAEPEANTFTLDLSFQFRPATTCNNQATASVVQGIEFTVNKWLANKRYELALQWQNVGDGAPQWRYWDASRPDKERWQPINTEVAYCLAGETWHTLNLSGQIIDGQIYYKNFTIDNITYNLDLTVPPVSTPGEEDRLAVAVQVDGNATASPYDLFIDKVSFVREAIIDCRSVQAAEIIKPLDNEIIKQDTGVTWSPACPMVLQYYQGDNPAPLLDEIADSGEFDFSMIPSGQTEVKIWMPGAGEPADSIFVIVD